MKIISLSDVSSKVFSVASVRAVKRTPLYQNLVVTQRLCNGFMFVEKGQCRYTWEGNSVQLEPGSLLYLPLGSRHTMDILSPGLEFIVVDFTLRDKAGDILLFSQNPLLISRQMGNYFADRIRNLAARYLEDADSFKSIAAVALLLSDICAQQSIANKKIAPAINCINANILEPVDADLLSSRCQLSKAQMYRLFKAETGLSPTDYRNRIRIEKACQMLATQEFYIYEVAMQLGFENIGYFNRVFKNQVGITPTEYINK